jgi:hypothetical protein
MRSEALEQIVRSLHARDIAAFPVVHAGVDEADPAVLQRMDKLDFSHMPLRDGNGDVVAVLDRTTIRRIPLGTKYLIGAGALLSEAIARLPGAGFLLVQSPESGYRDNISGIINHADVVSLPVRMLFYTRTMQLERRVLDEIEGKDWGGTPSLQHLWDKVEGMYRQGGDRRSCREAYLHFPEIMRIGQTRQILHVSDAERERLSTARNFASHAAIDAPAHELRPEVIPEEVERCARLLERLVANGFATQ